MTLLTITFRHSFYGSSCSCMHGSVYELRLESFRIIEFLRRFLLNVRNKAKQSNWLRDTITHSEINWLKLMIITKLYWHLGILSILYDYRLCWIFYIISVALSNIGTSLREKSYVLCFHYKVLHKWRVIYLKFDHIFNVKIDKFVIHFLISNNATYHNENKLFKKELKNGVLNTVLDTYVW